MRKYLHNIQTRIVGGILLVSAMSALSASDDNDGIVLATPEQVSMNAAPLSALVEQIETKHFKGISSVLVSRNGKLVFESYFSDANVNSLHNTRSLTKSITAILTGIAIDKKLIASTDALAFDYFPDYAKYKNDARKAAITIKDLLTMSSILECNDENQFSRGNEERMYIIEDWLKFGLSLPVRGIPAWELPAEKSPYGRAFSYCTAGTVIVGSIVERAVKKRLDIFADEVLHKPLGISNVQWQYTPNGTAMTGGGTSYRSRDLLKLGMVLLNKGEWQGRQIISEKWVSEMLSPYAVPRENYEYGYLIWRMPYQVRNKPIKAWVMAGNGGNYVLILPEENLIAVITSTAYNQNYGHSQSQEIMQDHILNALTTDL